MTPPLRPGEFRCRLDPLLAALGTQGAGPLVVAVSGGGDSMALLLLTHSAYPGRVHAATVDHGLRPGSADEAHQVEEWCAARGIPHRALKWTCAKPAAGIQAAARTARYALLATACAALGKAGLAAPLLVAHTLEDQAETFLLRLAHGSELGGLGGMQASSELASVPPVPLLRPLLGVSRACLRETLRQFGQAWIEDPSNDNSAFERVRLRGALAALGADGLDAQTLARTTRLMSRIDALMSKAARSIAHYMPDGSAVLDARELQRLALPVSLRSLSRLVRIVGGAIYPPRRDGLDRLLAQLADPAAVAATLGGCRFARVSAASWRAARELRGASQAAPASLEGGETILWDNRFWVRLPSDWRGKFTLQPLGAACRPEAGERGRVARMAREALPGLWRSGHLAAVPEIVPDARAWRLGDTRPVALFVGKHRVEGGLCSLWRDLGHAGASAERNREAQRVS